MRNRIRMTGAFTAVVLVSAFAGACSREPGAKGGGDDGAKGVPAHETAGKPAVARIAFVDQVEACECTKKRIEGGWGALQAALAKSPGVAVERIHLDEDEAKADAYDAMEALVVPPGVYFLDADGAFVALLQGEVTERQISEMLGRR